uniref:Homeobox domain-containing protein n=1 Tax=Leersia perrieri TaxID=77586 RepID=A0A0D9V5Y2_9ORYZ
MEIEAVEAGRRHHGEEASGAAPFGRSSSLLATAGCAEGFDGALMELKDLRSQLHQAADCCEKAFLDTEKKKLILESTKGYICDAIVAVIDHLGNVSSKLEHQLQEKIEITQTEKKLNFLKQLREEPKRKMVLTPGRERSVATANFESPTDATNSFSFRAEAGAFGRNEPAAAGGYDVEGGNEVQPASEAVEISSENAGPGCSQSQSGGGSGEDGDHNDGEGGDKQKRRKKYHRHTAEQIRTMEALFKESPHPDEMQRQQLSNQLGLSARQVKFWFQNRRTQIKAIQERHENSLLKSELEKLQEEHRAMRELVKKPSRCPNCGIAASTAATSSDAAAAATREQRLRLENAELKAEIGKIRGTPGKAVASSASPPCSAGAVETNSRRSPLLHGHDGGFLCRQEDKPRILELAGRALDEMVAMCSSGEPLWVRGVETGRDILNYDEYVRLFRFEDGGSGDRMDGWSVEASRECGVVYLDATQLVRAFMDVNQWKELFPSMISKAATLDVINKGEDDGRDGIVQLMYAELQMLTPMVPTREFYFARYCKKLAAERWAIVDVSFNKSETDIDATSPVMCWKNPSGCVIEEQTNGHCKLTWVEHTRCRRCTVPPVYRAVTASGVAFGARPWVAALQLHCERMVFAVATNVPTRDSNGVSTLAGRRSVLRLAHRMTSSLCRSIGGSPDLAWRRGPKRGGGGDGIWLASRVNAGDDPGEPQGLIAYAALSTWLPVNPTALLDLLRDESRRPEAARPDEEGEESGAKWILQDICTNPCESTIAYAAIDAAALQPVIAGHDSSGVPFLPCGFISVMPDGLESKPVVITASGRGGVAAGAGSLVTVAFQVMASSSTAAVLSPDSVEAVTGMVSSTLRNVRKALRCDDL